MYIDEANIARNIFERGYTDLYKPLSYEQFAPPLFLWIVKLCTQLFGYSEFAFRLYPLVSGILSLVIMYYVLRHFTTDKGIWYAMLLLAVGPIYVRYASATKQYIPDMFVALSLLWLALRNTFSTTSALRLFMLWTLAGSIAIWSSMPSVFILSGVWVYYFYDMVSKKQFDKLWFLFAAGFIWIVQFAFYYVTILKAQTGLPGLISYHQEFFFNVPVSVEVLVKDINLFIYFISTVGGHLGLPVVFHLACIIVGIIYLARNERAKLLLIVVPVLAVFFAALLHQYTLIQRVSLFAMPLLLIFIATGLQQILSIRIHVFRLGIGVCALINIINFNALKNFVYPMQEEEMKLSLNFLKQENISGNQLYVHNLAKAAYVYYTEINPAKDTWVDLRGAKMVTWNENFEQMVSTFPAKAAMLYGWDYADNAALMHAAKLNGIAITDSSIVKGGRVYIYTR